MSPSPTANGKTSDGDAFGVVASTTMDRDEGLVFNAITDMLGRSRLFRQLLDPRRSIEDECGYPAVGDRITPTFYHDLDQRGAVASRVTRMKPLETFQVEPSVYEDDDPDSETEFEAAWAALGEGLASASSGGASWYDGGDYNPMNRVFLQADIDSRLGRYGVILLGFDDGLPLWMPVAGVGELNSYPTRADDVDPETGKKTGKKVGLEISDLDDYATPDWDGSPQRYTYSLSVNAVGRGPTVNCGGKGGKPGPCPTGGHDLPHESGYVAAKRGNVETHVNPSKFKLAKLLKEHGVVRGLVDEHRLLVWDGNKALHNEMSEALGGKGLRSVVIKPGDQAGTAEIHHTHISLDKSSRSEHWKHDWVEHHPVLSRFQPVHDGVDSHHLSLNVETDPTSNLAVTDTGAGVVVPEPGTDPLPSSQETPGEEPLRLVYARSYPERLARVSRWESNPYSPRYGLPVTYTVTLFDPEDDDSGYGRPATATTEVHWTRIVHVSEGDVFHIPAMKQVLDNLLGLRKIDGASPEAVWKGAIYLLVLETNPDMERPGPKAEGKLKDMMESVQNGLQKYFSLFGMTAKSIAPTIADPTPHAAQQIERICIKEGCPVRVFKGSERGELASSQDDQAWNDRLKQRQTGHVNPNIIVPVVDRLIMVGVLPEPADGYKIHWPDLTSMTAAEKATVLLTRTQAYAAANSGGVLDMVSPAVFMTEFDDLTPAEAERVSELADEYATKKHAEDMQRQQEQIDAGLAPDPAAQQQAEIASMTGQPPAGEGGANETS